jgi:hypothetical protein
MPDLPDFVRNPAVIVAGFATARAHTPSAGGGARGSRDRSRAWCCEATRNALNLDARVLAHSMRQAQPRPAGNLPA